MGSERHGWLSYANVMATVAVFIALGGGAYAAFHLPRNSVKSKHIVNGQVKSKDVKDNGLTGTDVLESSLGPVPNATAAASADEANHATSADTATSAGSVDGMSVGKVNYTAPESASTALVDVGSIGGLTFSASCVNLGATTHMHVNVRETRNMQAMWTITIPGSTAVDERSDSSVPSTTGSELEDLLGTGPVFNVEQVVLTTRLGAISGPITLPGENGSVSLILRTAHGASGSDCFMSGAGVAG